MTDTVSTTIPAVGQWIRTDHHCWWTDATAERPATLHNAPIKVTAAVKLGGGNGDWRIETTRCDGTAMHLILNAEGAELLVPWDSARLGYEIVDAPEPDWCDVCDQVATPRHPATEHDRKPVSA